MVNNGWISLHRQIRDNPIYKNSKALHIWVECLLRAKHVEETVYLKREKITLKPGQFVMGRQELGEKIGISGSTIYFWLTRFKVDRMVDIKKTSKGSIVTILNWNAFQNLDSKVDNKKTAKKQQKNTYNNYNNILTKVNGEQNSPKEKNKLNHKKLIDSFMSVIEKNNDGILPVADNQKRTRQHYWNMLQKFGVRSEHKGIEQVHDLPEDIKKTANRFFAWWRKEKLAQGYNPTSTYKLKEQLFYFLTNVHDTTRD